MKRFWKEVCVEADGSGWTILLDGRNVRTPARAPLVVPARRLADGIADEWRSVNGEVNPRAMPLTGLANGAIDRIAPDPETFKLGVVRYAEADLLCYRSATPRELTIRHEERWDPLLDWARRRYDLDFVTTSGLAHVAQPRATIEQLSQAVLALDPFFTAGLSQLATIGGSLVGALAVFEKVIPPDEAWEALSVDERWQLERWGVDPEAQAALENRRQDFLAAARFLELLD